MTDDMPTTIRAAAERLRDASAPHESQLIWWLIDTVLRHTQHGSQCECDGDDWPCEDVRSAHKVAECIPARW